MLDQIKVYNEEEIKSANTIKKFERDGKRYWDKVIQRWFLNFKKVFLDRLIRDTFEGIVHTDEEDALLTLINLNIINFRS